MRGNRSVTGPVEDATTMRILAAILAVPLLLAGCGSQTAGKSTDTGPAMAAGTIEISPPPQIDNLLPGHPPYVTVRCGAHPQTSRPVAGLDPASACTLAGRLAAAERQVEPRHVVRPCPLILSTTPTVSGSIDGRSLAMPSCSTILRTRREQELAREFQVMAERTLPLRRIMSGTIQLHPPNAALGRGQTSCMSSPTLCLLIATWQQVVAHPVSHQPPAGSVECEMAEIPVASGRLGGHTFAVAYIPCAPGKLAYDRFGVALYHAIAKDPELRHTTTA